jgi:gamma-glutamyltranspeptidase/glutathione hydrolase
MTPGDLGFVMQNRGEMFSLTNGHANAYAPGKRPFHTIIPAFVTKDGQPFMSFGVMGAAMQPQGQVQVLNNVIDFGMDIQAAGDAPRVRHDGSSDPMGERMNNGGTVYLETGYGDETLGKLSSLGHSVSRDVGGYGGYQAIQRDSKNGVYLGASESRKDGHAAGY